MSAYEDLIADDDCLLFLRHEDGAGTTLVNDGSATLTITRESSAADGVGKFGRCTTLPAARSRIDIQSFGGLVNNAESSFATWLQWDTSLNGGYRSVFAGNSGFPILIDNSAGGALGVYRSAMYGCGLDVNSLFADGEWVHLGAATNGVDSTDFYVNGSFVGTAARSGVVGASGEWNIGSRPSVDQSAGSAVDESGVWTRQLTAGEFATLATGPVAALTPRPLGSPFLNPPRLAGVLIHA